MFNGSHLFDKTFFDVDWTMLANTAAYPTEPLGMWKVNACTTSCILFLRILKQFDDEIFICDARTRSGISFNINGDLNILCIKMIFIYLMNVLANACTPKTAPNATQECENLSIIFLDYILAFNRSERAAKTLSLLRRAFILRPRCERIFCSLSVIQRNRNDKRQQMTSIYEECLETSKIIYYDGCVANISYTMCSFFWSFVASALSHLCTTKIMNTKMCDRHHIRVA